ncbi:MAG: hypothetical protein J6Y65_02735, partial [Eggerthellaceae bacterium]|nr:hypothetical protein [Eggerthellaceae bacterium]
MTNQKAHIDSKAQPGLIFGKHFGLVIAAVVLTMLGLFVIVGQASGNEEPIPRSDNWSYEGKIADESPIVTVDGVKYVSGQILMSFDGSKTAAEVAAALQSAGVTVSSIELISDRLSDNDVLVLVRYAEDLTPLQVVAAVAPLEFVKNAEPNYIIELDDPNDPDPNQGNDPDPNDPNQGNDPDPNDPN